LNTQNKQIYIKKTFEKKTYNRPRKELQTTKTNQQRYNICRHFLQEKNTQQQGTQKQTNNSKGKLRKTTIFCGACPQEKKKFFINFEDKEFQCLLCQCLAKIYIHKKQNKQFKNKIRIYCLVFSL